MMSKTRSTFILLVAAAMALSSVFILGAHAQGSDELVLQKLEIRGEIRNHYAVTTFHAHLENPTDTARELSFSMDVPDDAMLTNLSVEMDGIISYGRVVDKGQAQTEYDDAKDSGDTASQIKGSSDPRHFEIMLNIRAGSTVVISISYAQIMVKEMYDYTYLLPVGALSIADHFPELFIDIDIKGMGHIDPISIDEGLIPRESVISMDHFHYSYNSTAFTNNDLMKIVYREDAPPINGTLHTCLDETGGYFMHVFSPQLEDLGTYLPKDIIFVLDRSGSMGGIKIEQLKDAFEEIVGQLHTEDRFNLITFSSDIDTWKEEIVIANGENKDASIYYIKNIEPQGSTNIDQALKDGLDMFEGDVEAVPIIVFLTDGIPTAGETIPANIRQNILSANQDEVSIYSLGFGEDVDFDFLSALSLENSGYAVKIPESQDASGMMQGFYETISVPLLMEIEFTYTGASFDVIPTYLPSLFDGSEAVVVGKFDPTRSYISSLVTGTTSTGQRVFEENWEVRDDPERDFIPRLWAHRMIDNYMQRMIVEGETEELQQKVIDLALEFSFATSYTSFILVIEDPDSQTSGVEGNDREGVDDDPPPFSGDDDYDGDGSNDPLDIYDDDDGSDAATGGEKRDDDLIPLISDDEGDGAASLFLFGPVAILVVLGVLGLIIFAYTRIRREDLLNQENRKRIYEFITDNPGEHFRALQRAVDLEVGVLSHHLNVLEKEQLIVSEQDGNNRRFWAAGVKHDHDKVHLSRIQENILKQIDRDPGITQAQIAKKIGVSRKVVFYHVKFLRNAGIVREEKEKRKTHYYSKE
ncbi:MAG: VWA domain-containing protein [Thermoplasmatota archaeon]